MFAYKNQMQQERIRVGVHFNAAQNYEFIRTSCERFVSMSEADQKVIADKAKRFLAKRDAAAEEAKPGNVAYSEASRWDNCVQRLGSDKEPLSLDVFRLEISRALGLDAEEDFRIHWHRQLRRCLSATSRRGSIC